MNGIPFVMSHFKDESKYYHLLEQFFCKLLQIFFIHFIVIFLGKIINFFTLYFLKKCSNKKFKISIQQNEDNNIGNHMKKTFFLS